jgi:excinuclease ABC subunit B
MERAIGETNRRRAVQMAYNEKHGITPETIRKEIHDIAASMRTEHQKTVHEMLALDQRLYREDPKAFITSKRAEMADAVEALDFETAAVIRDEIYALEGKADPKERGKKGRKRKPLSGG